ncbi:MAG: lysylphosphatidylglycerol synthase transmembrane domain-containing protein [Chitinophagaceae bacterium]
MKKKLLSIFKYIFFLGLGVFLVWWQFDKMTSLQKAQFGQSLRYANYWLLIPVIILAILSHISRAVRWKILIEPMGYKPSTTIAFYSIMSGYLLNTFVPRAGEILKCSLLSRYEKIPMNKLIGTILVERTFDLICYFIFIIITILIQINYVSAFVMKKFSQMAHNNSGTPVWIKLLLIIIIIILAIYFLKWLIKRFAHHRHIISLKGFHIGLKEGFTAIAHLKNRGWFIFHTIFIWLMYLLEIYIGFSALSATSHLGIIEACSVLSLATLGMIVSPGGIGAFPLAVQEVLLIYNVDNVSFGWLIWGVSTAIVIVVGLISLGLLMYKNKNLNETKQTGFNEAI